MTARRKFDKETGERALRIYLDRLAEHGDFKLGARKKVGALLVNPATLRKWVEKGKDIGGAQECPRGSDRDEELKAHRRENA